MSEILHPRWNIFPADVGIPAVTLQVNEFERKNAILFREKSMQRVQAYLPNVQIAQLPNTTHMSIGVYKVDSLAQIIDRFLGSPS